MGNSTRGATSFSAIWFCIATVCASEAAWPQSTGPDAVFKGDWRGPDPDQEKAWAMAPAPDQSRGSRSPSKPHVLILGGSPGFHHYSISAALAAFYNWGRASSAWDAELSTDFALLKAAGGEPMHAGFQPKGLKDFDAIVVANAVGDWQLTTEQKSALLSFVRENGKGIVVVHGGLDANHNWRDYIDMVGGEFTGHPFNTRLQPIVSFAMINEAPDFPAVAHLPRSFKKQDEIYIVKNWSRSDVRVLLRLDEDKLDYTGRDRLVPPDRDMPVAWVKNYGKGRVFASSIGHTWESFDDPDVSRMYTEALKWVLRLTDGDAEPKRRPR